MNVILVALSAVGLFVFPIVAYGVVWLTSRRGNTERPEPPETNRPDRTIPGRNSGRTG